MYSIPFTLRQLEYFNAIAVEGSLSAAAERCHVSASALALGINELETRLSVQLIVRQKGKGVTLTATGARVLALARSTLTSAESLMEDVWKESASLTGRLTIGCFSTLVPFFLPSIVQDFQAAYPELELDFIEADAPQLHDLVLQGRVDVALVYSVDVSPQVLFEPVLEYQPHVLVNAHHRLSNRKAIHLAEVANESFIGLDVYPSKQNTQRIFDEVGITAKLAHMTSNFELVRSLVARGLGYTVMFQQSLSNQTYDGREVVSLELIDPLPATVVGLIRPDAPSSTARYRALRDFLLQSDSLPSGQ